MTMEESAQIAAEYIASLDNLPNEVKFILNEIKLKDTQLQSTIGRIQSREVNLFKNTRNNKPPINYADENVTTREIEDLFQKARKLSDENVELARRLKRLIHKAKGRLAADMKKITKLTGEPIAEDLTPSATRGVDKIAEGLRQALATPSSASPAASGPAQKKRRLTSSQVEKVVLSLPLGRSRLSQVQPSPLRKSTTVRSPDASEEEAEEGEEEDESDDNIYCFCQKKSFGEMIGCDNEQCRYQWFHLECVGLKPPLPDSWYCSDCIKKGFGSAGEKRKGRKVK
ncbi:hypothetical protein DACRYDRAFT_113224 [Dacryopinax primogenitus]|uniref:Chromatin modification-related protein n=1 Tax=Dacryopinax primogenitus (strain DJM 731) TaxID=1858805 RepID=M5GH34_DACPD|nr:uncharacterized protein DACRYDRAFT_113224 [Dacryopinax primogenitus]EJU06543.1 hypothetical protein DACRYDRAFT_113224 [Dacryopinax primogenitus]